MTEVERIRAAIIDFMTKTECTQKQIADESGLSAGLVSQFMSGTYGGDNQKVADTLNKYLSIAKERLNCCNTDVFYPHLENTKIVLNATRYAHRKCEMVLVRGDSGAGKTTRLAVLYSAKCRCNVCYSQCFYKIRSTDIKQDCLSRWVTFQRKQTDASGISDRLSERYKKAADCG